ncbi:MAG: LacI family DNA-binding transcriptional regulator [Mycetocola sp.]
MSVDATARRVTAADVARASGLSRATVGFVLNDTPGQTIPAATRERVLSEAKRLGYRPNMAARALSSGKSRIVLLVLPEWPLDYSMRANLDEASLTLDRAGYALVTMTPHPGGQAQPLWETLNPDVVMGMTPFTDEQLTQIRASGVEHIFPPTSKEPRSIEEFGFENGPRLQALHLLERGARSIAFAGSADPRIQELVNLRRMRATQTLKVAGYDLAGDEDIDPENVGRVLHEWTAGGVDGVIAYNDDIAAMLVGSAVRAGIAVPKELKVIGHDDTPLAQLFVPALSSVRVDTAGTGLYLATVALNAVARETMPVAGPETDARVIPRETT